MAARDRAIPANRRSLPERPRLVHVQAGGAAVYAQDIADDEGGCGVCPPGAECGSMETFPFGPPGGGGAEGLVKLARFG